MLLLSGAKGISKPVPEALTERAAGGVVVPGRPHRTRGRSVVFAAPERVCRLIGQAPIAPSPVIDDWRLLRCGTIFSG